MDTLKDKGAVVTGAASGIGKAIATAFIEAGASVLLCDLNAKALEAAASELGHRALGRVTDVSDESQVEGAMRFARRCVRLAGYRRQLRGLWRHYAAHRADRREVEIRPGRDARRRLLRREARRPADARAGTRRRHHQHLVGERTAGGRRASGLLRGEGRRRHAHALRRLGARRSRHPCRRHRARPRRDAVDEARAGEPRDARAFLEHDPDEPRGCNRKRLPTAAVFLASDNARSINGHTIVIDGGSLTRGYPALLTGLRRAS